MIPTVMKQAGYVTAQRRQVGPDAARARRLGLRRIPASSRAAAATGASRTPATYTRQRQDRSTCPTAIPARPDARLPRRTSSTGTRTSRSSSTTRCRTSTARSSARPTASRARRRTSSTPTTSPTWTSWSASSWPNSTGCSCARRRWSSSPATTARRASAPNRPTVNGSRISGKKGTMLEGGSRVPLIVNWPGTTPAGRCRTDLVDFSDFFADLRRAGRGEAARGRDDRRPQLRPAAQGRRRARRASGSTWS